MLRVATAALVGLGLLASCAPPVPALLRPRDPLLDATFGARFAADTATPSAARMPWRELLRDAALESLIADALARNNDLQVALQRVELARATIRGTSGARLPQVNLVVGGSLRRFGDYTMDGAGNMSTDIRPGQRVPEHYSELGLSLQASWEVDLWRRLGALQGAARARYLASVEGANLVISTLIAEIASGYVDLIALDRAREILEQSIARQERVVEVMRAEKAAGRTNELAVKQFQAQLGSSRVLLARVTRDRDATENDLNVLAGRGPRPVARAPTLLDAQVAALGAGLPGDLLANRPDVRQAERELAARQLDVRAARAAFYPRLQLTAGIGYNAFDPRFVFSTPASLVYNLAAGVVAPLVNRRGIQAQFAAANALQQEALFRYQGVVLRGVGDVATALGVVSRSREIVVHQVERQATLSDSVEIAEALFRAGKATYLEVLLAQENTRDAELDLVAARRDQLVARVQLYKALGGGWHGQLEAGR